MVTFGHRNAKGDLKTPSKIFFFGDLAEDVKATSDGTLKDMPMFGYWEGDIDVKTNNIQMSLGRMLTRINLK